MKLTTTSVNIKLIEKDAKALRRMANKYADGNLSSWLRNAGLKYIPKTADAVKAYPHPKRAKK